MFISESYIHYQDDFTNTSECDDDEFVDVSFGLNPLRRKAGSKYLSKSADLIYRGSKGSLSRGYEGDTDSDANETPGRESVYTRCQICNLEFMHDILAGTNPQDFFVVKKKLKRKRRKSLSGGSHLKTCSLQCVDFDKYKDENHKMEVFTPDSERKWTLQYEYNGQRQHPMLAKVIIGRGQNDEHPELNNIHLIDELKDYKQCKWRVNFLNYMKSRNEVVKECFSLLPSVNTCLFCFNERNKVISQNIQDNAHCSFKLPSLLSNEMDKLDLNNDPMKADERDSSDQVFHTTSSECRNEADGRPNGDCLHHNEEERPLNGIVPHALGKERKDKKGRLVRTGYFSDKLFKKFTKKKVEIELPNEINKKQGNPSQKRDGALLKDAVDVVLMYSDNNTSNNVKTQMDKSDRSQRNMSKDNLSSGKKGRRKIRRKVDGKLHANSSRTEEAGSSDDDDDDFVIIM